MSNFTKIRSAVRRNSLINTHPSKHSHISLLVRWRLLIYFKYLSLEIWSHYVIKFRARHIALYRFLFLIYKHNITVLKKYIEIVINLVHESSAELMRRVVVINLNLCTTTNTDCARHRRNYAIFYIAQSLRQGTRWTVWKCYKQLVAWRHRHTLTSSKE